MNREDMSRREAFGYAATFVSAVTSALFIVGAITLLAQIMTK